MMGDAEKILFPERVVRVRCGWRTVTVVVRPFSLRQLRAVKLYLADPLELATGLTKSQVRRMKPHVAIALQKLIDEVNQWDPKELNHRDTESTEKKNTKADEADFYGMAAELVLAGHDRESVWDLTPVQFVWWVNQARRLRGSRVREETALDAQAVLAAIGAAFSKDGSKAFEQWLRKLTADTASDVNHRDTERTEERNNGKTPGRRLADLMPGVTVAPLNNPTSREATSDKGGTRGDS